jgi:hypothetical protein
MYAISFSKRKPATAFSSFAEIPTFDACARCAVPNASLTKIPSPSEASIYQALRRF